MNLKPGWLHKPSLTFVFQLTLKLLTVTGIIAIGIVIWAIYFEEPPIRYQNLPFPVETPVEQGRTIPIVIERCNDSKTERVYMSTRQIRNVITGKVIMLPNATVSISPGCHRGTSRTAVVPVETEIGVYIAEGDAIIKGTMKEHRLEWYTEPFEVIRQKAETRKLEKENATQALLDRIRQGSLNQPLESVQ